jgi:hypothetical protein
VASVAALGVAAGAVALLVAGLGGRVAGADAWNRA